MRIKRRQLSQSHSGAESPERCRERGAAQNKIQDFIDIYSNMDRYKCDIQKVTRKTQTFGAIV